MNPSDPSLTKSRVIDLPFVVPCTHRLRLTDDVSNADFGVLENLLDGGETGRARVLLVSESALSEQAGAITRQLRESSSIELVAEPIWVEGGESIKNSEFVLRTMLDTINDQGLDRRSYIVAMGGGAMLDAVGFAAAIAHRGIRLVRLPSTVLAQADSGVGVKNAINYFEKKNWIGTFAVPWAVVNDMSLLSTLPDRDFVSGFSEAVKVSLLKDQSEFDWLCENAECIRRRQRDCVQHAIHQSCLSHLQHITSGGDPFEMLEARPLDFGHWSAHRLEPLTKYEIRHGEAVAIGVAIDCLYSSFKYGLPEADALRVCDCLQRLGMKLWHESLFPLDRLLQGLEEFRQHLGGRLTITMLKAVGDPVNVHEVDIEAMKKAIAKLQSIAIASE